MKHAQINICDYKSNKAYNHKEHISSTSFEQLRKLHNTNKILRGAYYCMNLITNVEFLRLYHPQRGREKEKKSRVR